MKKKWQVSGLEFGVGKNRIRILEAVRDHGRHWGVSDLLGSVSSSSREKMNMGSMLNSLVASGMIEKYDGKTSAGRRCVYTRLTRRGKLVLRIHDIDVMRYRLDEDVEVEAAAIEALTAVIFSLAAEASTGS